jgi:hypothetical protein
VNIAHVTPWIALASGLRESPKSHFDFDWDYDLGNSYRLGAALNLSSKDNQDSILYKMSDVIFFMPPGGEI